MQLVVSRALLDAEDGPQDHVEGQRLHRPHERERLVDGPGVDLAVGRLPHDRLVRPHALAVEGRQEQAALPEVLGAVQQEHGPLSQHRAEQLVRLARAELVRVAPEDLLDQLGIEDDHEAGVEERPERDDVSVAAPARVHEAGCADDETERLDELRKPGTGG